MEAGKQYIEIGRWEMQPHPASVAAANCADPRKYIKISLDSLLFHILSLRFDSDKDEHHHLLHGFR